jgi:hypothetical protein
VIQYRVLTIEQLKDPTMRRRRIRITVGSMMIAVAAVALLIGFSMDAHRLIHRVQGYRYWAMLHSLTEKRLLGDLASTQGAIARCKDPAAVRARWQKAGFAPEDLKLFVRDDRVLVRRAEVLGQWIAYHARMREHFEAAAWRPWLSVHQEPMPEGEP